MLERLCLLSPKSTNIMSDSEYSTAWSIPPDVLGIAKTVTEGLLPTKSTAVYEASYRRFMQWCDEKNIKCYPEGVLLAYFSEIGTNMKSSTMWSRY